MSEVGCDIVEYLKEFHTSEGKAVKARELCVLFNVHEKQLRNIVSDLRQNGEAICSSTKECSYSKRHWVIQRYYSGGTPKIHRKANERRR